MSLRAVDLATIEPSVAEDAMAYITEELNQAMHQIGSSDTTCIILDHTSLPLGAFGVPARSSDRSPAWLVGTPELFRRGYTIAGEAHC